MTVRSDVRRAAAKAEIEERLGSLEMDGELKGVKKLKLDYQPKAVAVLLWEYLEQLPTQPAG